MSFASYNVASSLQFMGWPKEQGTFRRRAVVSTRAVGMAVDRMVETCAGLGAGAPQIAACVLQNAVPMWDYKEKPAEQLIRFLQSYDDVATDPLHPYRIVFGGQPALATILPSRENAPWDDVFDNGQNQIWFSLLSARAIVWGLAHRYEIRTALAAQLDGYNDGIQEAIYAGVDLPSIHPYSGAEQDPFDSFVADCLDSVADYEQDVGPLAPAPPALVSTKLFASGRSS